MGYILMGLLSALFLGFADFIATQNSRRIGALYSLAGMLFASSIVLTIYLFFTGGFQNLLILDNYTSLIMGVLHGILMALALLLFFHALTIGKVFIVAPIIAAHPVFIILFYFLNGKFLTFSQLIAISAVIIGVVTISISSKKNRTSLNKPDNLNTILIISLSSSFLYAVSLLALQYSSLFLPEINVLWLARFFGFLTVIFIILSKMKFSLLYDLKWWLIFFCHGFLDSIGLLFIIVGTTGSKNDALLLVLASTFPVITMILAWYILKEKMNFFQFIGVKLIIISIGYLIFFHL